MAFVHLGFILLVSLQFSSGFFISFFLLQPDLEEYVQCVGLEENIVLKFWQPIISLDADPFYCAARERDAEIGLSPASSPASGAGPTIPAENPFTDIIK